jgi:stage V sporulation protein G
MEDATIQISRIHKVEGDTKLRAFVDISLGGVIVKGLRIVQGANGLFLAMPRHQGKDGKWYNTVFPSTKEIYQQLSEQALTAYQE